MRPAPNRSSGAPHVTVRLTDTDNAAIVEVEDDGEGIDAAVLPHVFEPFRQQNGTAVRRHEGMGLGEALTTTLAWYGATVTATDSAGAARDALANRAGRRSDLRHRHAGRRRLFIRAHAARP